MSRERVLLLPRRHAHAAIALAQGRVVRGSLHVVHDGHGHDGHDSGDDEEEANEVIFNIVAGPGRHYGEWYPYLELPPELGALEVELVEGPVLDDYEYITDYSTISPNDDGSQTLRRYQALTDVLAPDELARCRQRVSELLTRLLAPGHGWVLFFSGPAPESGLFDDLERVFTARMYDLAADLNGAFTIFDAGADVSSYASLLGDYDRVAGLRAPDDSFARVLAQLSLRAPLPTGQRYRPSSPIHALDTRALARVLEVGDLWFEEIDNGTRLRFIARVDALERLREQLVGLIDALNDDDDDDDEQDEDADDERGPDQPGTK